MIKIEIEFGFNNLYKSHTVYQLGSQGADPKDNPFAYADSPEKSDPYKMLSGLTEELKHKGIEQEDPIPPWWYDFYKMLSGLTEELKHKGIEQEDPIPPWWYDFSTWQRFCQFAVGTKSWDIKNA